MSNNLLNSIYHLKDVLIKSKRIVFLTGSGISKESGIPTFRGKDGLWKKHDIETGIFFGISGKSHIGLGILSL